MAEQLAFDSPALEGQRKLQHRTGKNDRGWHIAKIVLRSLAASICLMLVGFSLAGSLGQYLYNWFGLPPGISALVYNVAELAVLWVNSQTLRGIHPAVTLSADLLIWLGTVVCITMLSLFRTSWKQDYNNTTTIDIVVFVLMFILVALEFTLFVRACVETARRNRSNKQLLDAYRLSMAQSPNPPVEYYNPNEYEDAPPQVPSPDYDVRPQDATHKELIPGKAHLRG